MADFLSDPSVLTKEKLKRALMANNVALPNGEQRKGVYVELYLRNLTAQNKSSGSADAFSSDEEPPAAASATRSGRKATRKTDRVRPEEIDVTDLTSEELKDQLLKYGVNAGPIVASTRKVYEKKLQRLLDQGPPQTTVIEPVPTHNSRNGSADSDQYSDKEEETAAAQPEPEPEPVPMVERPLRSRGKTPVTTRTRSSQHKVSAPEMFPVVQERSRFSAMIKDPKLPMFPSDESSSLTGSPDRRTVWVQAALDDYGEGFSTDELGEGAAALSKASVEEVQLSLLDTALLEVDPHEVLSAGPDHVGFSQELNSASTFMRTKQSSSRFPVSAPPSRDLIHTTRRLSPSGVHQGGDSPRSFSRMDPSHRPTRDLPVVKSSPDVKERSGGSSAAVQSRLDEFFCPVTPVRWRDESLRDQKPGGPIEKLSAVEQTPKPAERDVLKEMFPHEVLSTPTGISATRRQPIKGAAGRPFSDTWQDSLRPRLTEHRYTSSSYTETRSVPRVSVVPRVSAVPLPAPRLAAPPSVQAKPRRRVPVWVQLLLLAAVTGFLLFIYQAMESNQTSPFGQLGRTAEVENNARK
ncbi:thymopoietin a isoform X2 [Neoarius graeffei]|uniref:thymopoietin a isoform X2 n=1 Tax=Neoarius graeffei TaxID=443677 RepID=UPI00298C2849|nr:thymopoietin a isoform X2 [Neoarius graeffei]